MGTNIFCHNLSLHFLLRKMATEHPGWSEFTQSMSDHILCYVYRHMPASIVHSDRMANHLGKDSAGPAPGTDDFLIAPFIHGFDFLQE
jgi:hypothetical protein